MHNSMEYIVLLRHNISMPKRCSLLFDRAVMVTKPFLFHFMFSSSSLTSFDCFLGNALTFHSTSKKKKKTTTKTPIKSRHGAYVNGLTHTQFALVVKTFLKSFVLLAANASVSCMHERRRCIDDYTQ